MPVRRDGDAFVFRPAAGERLRVLVLCSDDPHHRYLLSELAERLDVRGAVIEPGAAQQRGLWRPGRRRDWLARRWHVERQRLTGRRSYREAYFEPITDVARIAALPQLVASSVNAPATIEWIRARRPDVTVVCGTMYLQRSVLACTGVTVNVHAGYLPDYRGNHAIFFAYERGDWAKVAATLHVVTAELDGGEIVEVVHPDVYPHDGDDHLYCRAVHAAIGRLRELLLALESGATLVCRAQPYTGAMYRHRDRTPLHDLALWARRRTGAHPVPHLPARGRNAHAELRRPVPVGPVREPRRAAAGARS
jgi:hypothetical protein